MVVNEKGEFKESNFTKAMGLLQHELGEDPADPKSGRANKGKSNKGGNKKRALFLFSRLDFLYLIYRYRIFRHIKIGPDDHAEKLQPRHRVLF